MNNNESVEKVDDPKAIETAGHSYVQKDSSLLVERLDEVLRTLEKLEKTVSDSPIDVKAIHKSGSLLEEKWDVIEKQVEEIDKASYMYIEETLYPLIAEAKKDSPNVENMKALMKQTQERLIKFKEEVAT